MKDCPICEKRFKYYRITQEYCGDCINGKEYKKIKGAEYYAKKKSDLEWLDIKRTKGREGYRRRARLDPGFANRQFKDRYYSDPEFRKRKIKYAVDYARKIKEKKYVWSMNYFARKRNAEGAFTTEQWETILQKFNYSCAFCRVSENITIDHVIPLSKGGTNYPENLQPLCRSCNSRKSNKVLVNK